MSNDMLDCENVCVRSDQSSDSVEKTPVMFPSAADTAGGEGAICLSIFNSVNKE